MSGAVREIDGSKGEGGGQILRSSLALALATGTPVRVRNVRAGRDRPGLLRQHLAAVRAAAAVCSGEVEGAVLGSTEVVLRPGAVRPGEYRFAVGTAGSAGLVLQTVLLPLCLAGGGSTLVLEGGTHNPAAPPFDFLAKAWLPLLGRMGFPVEAVLDRHGFFPAGGGRFTVRVGRAGALSALSLMERGEVVARRGRVLVAGLPAAVGERERAAVVRGTGWGADSVLVEEVDSAGPGNAVLLEVGCAGVFEVFSAFGEYGVRAEVVAERVVKEYRGWLGAGGGVGRRLADQLLLPMALGGGGEFRTVPLSGHSRTHVEVLREFGFEVRVESEKRSVTVEVGRGGVPGTTSGPG